VKKAPTLRLDRLLANLGYGSRREVQQLVRFGAVTLDGAKLHDADGKIAVTLDLSGRMRVEGKPLDPPPGVALMLHKPLGVTCSHKEAGQLVYELLPERWRLRDPAISTIGRLDKDSSGLLLMTDDGGLLHKVISPRSQVSKRYDVILDRPLRGDEAAVFASGELMLEGEDKPLLPVPMETLGPNHARVTLMEGRYHQVRRMFAAVGNHVTALHRDRVGGLALPDDLAPGQYRLLTTGDLDAVFGTTAASDEAETTPGSAHE
jgi:16S rRNA pseudouridine516 synthase